MFKKKRVLKNLNYIYSLHSTADPWTTQGLRAPTLCVVENLCLTLQLALRICSFASVDSSNHASCEKMWVQVNPQSSSFCCSRAKCSIELGLSTTTLLSGQQPLSYVSTKIYIHALSDLFSLIFWSHSPSFSQPSSVIFWAPTTIQLLGGHWKHKRTKSPVPCPHFSHVYSPLLMHDSLGKFFPTPWPFQMLFPLLTECLADSSHLSSGTPLWEAYAEWIDNPPGGLSHYLPWGICFSVDCPHWRLTSYHDLLLTQLQL